MLLALYEGHAIPGIVEWPHFVGIQHYMLPLLVQVVFVVCSHSKASRARYEKQHQAL